MEKKVEMKDTLNLPYTEFPMKANLPQREPKFLERWEKINIYKKMLEARKGRKKYVLHDGPPYANGHIHLGHTLNKILKDIIIKYKHLRGFQTPYIPGWDCHGLPIEMQVLKDLGIKDPKTSNISPTEIRKKSREYAEKFINIQREEFKRLGVFGDWDNPYLTMSKEYEASIIEAFGLLVEKGLIYRGNKPVHWCWSCKTALAEAELEYYEKESPSIYVKFPITKLPERFKNLNGKAFVLIWTTTPWTLPANTALAFHPSEPYVFIKSNGEYYIVAEKLLNSIAEETKIQIEEVIDITRQDLESIEVKHPFIDRVSKIIFADFVTMDTGTGIVHIAPGHGMEDYEAGIKYNLPVISPVDDEGKFTSEVKMWEGLHVFSANTEIIKYLENKGVLLYHSTIKHQYPHCWRCKNPIIFRAKPQWFFNVSKLQEQAVKCINEVKWYPEWGKTRIENMVKNRTDWCLSRQRYWGVPIPVFYCKNCGETILDPNIIKHVKNIVLEKGLDYWFEADVKELLPKGFRCPKCGSEEFEKETDILDVWFDSGVSWFAVLEKTREGEFPADMYLEGSDQHRGWFQSSLWPSVAIKGTAPYKEVLTHGFVLDEEGRAMHKSLGNVISPFEFIDKYGADVVRLWVVSEDYHDDVKAGFHLMDKIAESYRKIRNTFRYMLGNLYDFNPEKHSIPYQQLTPIDKWALAKLYKFSKEIEKYYDNYEFYKVYKKVLEFFIVDLSSFYFDVLKDRLYVLYKDDPIRRSSQTVLYHLLKYLNVALAPILPFTMEEVYLSFFTKDKENDSIFISTEWVELPSEWENEKILEDWNLILEIRDVVLKGLEVARKQDLIHSSLEAKVKLSVGEGVIGVLKEYEQWLKETFIVSQLEWGKDIVISEEELKAEEEVKVGGSGSVMVKVGVVRAEGEKCSRCWMYSPTVGKDPDYPEVCDRCASILRKMGV